MEPIRKIRWFLLIETLSFGVAALVHFGLIAQGYAHLKAGIAESVIGTVLAAGLAAAWLRRDSARTAGLYAQGFALVGTCVGLFTIAIGVGPRTAPDLVYHAAILAVLALGWLTAKRASRSLPGRPIRPVHA